jgi:general stress protein 26
MATVDHKGRPSPGHASGSGSTGWIISWPASQTRHLQRNPYVSLAYFCHDIYRPVYVDCTAEWVNDRAEQQRVWAYYQTVPPPMGFDPQPHYGTIDHPHFGLLKLTPWRIELFTLDQSDAGQTEMITKVWRPAQER